MNVKTTVADASATDPADWEFTTGPETGVGAEYWLQNPKAGLEAYICIDQGDLVALDIHDIVRYDDLCHKSD